MTADRMLWGGGLLDVEDAAPASAASIAWRARSAGL